MDICRSTESKRHVQWAINCPCSNTNVAWAFEIPSFIGFNTFVTLDRGPGYTFTAFYLNDPHWGW